MREVENGIFQIDITLPKSPLKIIHSYFIKSAPGERSLLVDTGFNNPQSLADMKAALVELGADLSRTDIFLTHLHADHTGMLYDLLTGENVAFASASDAKYMELMAKGGFKDIIIGNMELSCTPEERRLDYRNHPAMVHGMSGSVDFERDFKIAAPGHILNVGEYRFEILDLSGHTPGQLGLYEQEKRFLLCGDHVIKKITPNIVQWDDGRDYIQMFTDNLRKLLTMDIDIIYSAHRDDITEPKQRIAELLAHHENRLAEMVSIVSAKPSTAYEIAQRMTWDFGGGDFEAFPVQQVWFAVSEALAHAEHLVHAGRFRVDAGDGRRLYSLASPLLSAPENS